ncbi:MAG: hypothetical protein QXZ33_04245, partial [Metallosphaera sp.]
GVTCATSSQDYGIEISHGITCIKTVKSLSTVNNEGKRFYGGFEDLGFSLDETNYFIQRPISPRKVNVAT